MGVEFRELRWAIIASQHRSLRQAAERLNIRQSTLSRRLRDLEEKLGATLFERTTGGSRPTAVGQEFLEAARRILDETELITSRVKTRSRGESGQLTIGVHASLTAGNLRATLLDHKQRYPQVDTYIVDGSSDHLICDISHGAIDIAFLAGGYAGTDHRMLSVWSERVVVALPSTHPLSEVPFLHWPELKGQMLIVSQRGPGAEFMELLTGKLGVAETSRIVRQDVGLDRLLTLVGAGWGLLPALEGATGVAVPGVVFREVHDLDGPTRLNFMACWRRTNGNPSLDPFLNVLRERYPDLSEVAELP